MRLGDGAHSSAPPLRPIPNRLLSTPSTPLPPHPEHTPYAPYTQHKAYSNATQATSHCFRGDQGCFAEHSPRRTPPWRRGESRQTAGVSVSRIIDRQDCVRKPPPISPDQRCNPNPSLYAQVPPPSHPPRLATPSSASRPSLGTASPSTSRSQSCPAARRVSLRQLCGGGWPMRGPRRATGALTRTRS